MAKKKRRLGSVFLLVMLGVVLVSYYHCLPSQLFQNVTHSSVLYAEDGRLLSASVSDEEQWYFPQLEELPRKYITAVLAFEDKRFFKHIGVDF
jgi:penicillin-binding protein 1C